MLCTVSYSVSKYFKIFPEIDEWFCPLIEKWASLFDLTR
jgi:hypothetical protein